MLTLGRGGVESRTLSSRYAAPHSLSHVHHADIVYAATHALCNTRLSGTRASSRCASCSHTRSLSVTYECAMRCPVVTSHMMLPGDRPQDAGTALYPDSDMRLGPRA
eukprot:3802067-Rhodomonas_salina.2